MGLIENQFNIIYCPQRKGVLLLLPCIQILYQPHNSEAFALQNIPCAFLSVILLPKIVSKCHILSPVEECRDQLYRPYYVHALKQTIQPLHATVSSMPVVTAAFQMCCEVSFVSLCQTNRTNPAALSAKLIGRVP